MTMRDRTPNDRLALPYRDTGMAEIGLVYFPVLSFSSGRLPLDTRHVLNDVPGMCGTREEVDDVCVVVVRS